MKPVSMTKLMRSLRCSVRNGARCARFPSTPGACRSPNSRFANLLPGNGKGKTGVEGIEAYGIVDDAAWKDFLAGEAQVENKTGEGFRSVITCYNGQTVNTTSGSEEGVVNDIELVLTRGANNQAEGRVAYRPIVTPIQEGRSLQVTPLVNTSGKFVMLDVHSRVSVREPAVPGKRPAARDDDQGPAAIVAALDRPRLATQRLATTLTRSRSTA